MGMTRLRRFATPLRLARARLARRLERVALVALGIAVGAAMLAAVLGGSLLARDRSLERATAHIAPSDRAVRALWFGIPAQDAPRAQLDAWAQHAIRPFGEVTRAMVYRETSVNGHVFDLAAVDHVPEFVHMTSGRPPRACTSHMCEVVQLAGSGPIPDLPGLKLVRVGTARLWSSLPFGTLLTRESTSSLVRSARAYHAPPSPPFLLAEGVNGTAVLPALAFQYRSYAWAAGVYPNRVHPWNAGGFGASVERARSELSASSSQFDVTAPTDAVAMALSDSNVSGRRLLLIGGEAAALLLAFTVLAATRLRRDADATWRRLTWFGARTWQLTVLSAAEAIAIALAGTLVGWTVGCLAVVPIAHKLRLDGITVLSHSALAPSGIATAAGAALVATLVLVVVLRIRPTPIVFDTLAVGALGAIVLAIGRGSADAQSLASGGTGTVLILLPGLIAFVAAVLTARLLAPALRFGERRGRRAPVAFRLAALSLARNPGYAAVAVTFLVVSLGFALFAQAYRETLAEGQRDEANFAVPVDAIAKEDLSSLVPVLHAAPLADFERLGRAAPVLRLSGGLAHVDAPFTLVGLPPDELTHLRWRADNASVPPRALARKITFPAQLHGIRLPAPGFTLPVSVHGDPITVDANIVTSRGDFVRVRLGTARGRMTLHARTPAGLLVALTFGLTNTGLHEAANGGTGAQTINRGTLDLGRAFPGWIGTNGVAAQPGNTISYLVSPQLTSRFRARQVTDDRPVPVLATPRIAAAAAPGGRLTIGVEGQALTVQVVGTIQRFPTVNGDAVVADGLGLSTALNAESPGAAVTNEVWLSGSNLAPLRRPPFNVLAVQTHIDVAQRLRSEPLARGTLLVLAAAAAAALALALVAIVLGLVADVRDDLGELFDLESQGARPATLRRHLRLRALAVAGFGLAGGLATGAVLSALAVRFVVLTASGSSPAPPLRLAIGWPLVALALALFTAFGAVLVAAITRHAFHAQTAGRYTEVGT
jgi:hypothetical protein